MEKIREYLKAIGRWTDQRTPWQRLAIIGLLLLFVALDLTLLVALSIRFYPPQQRIAAATATALPGSTPTVTPLPTGTHTLVPNDTPTVTPMPTLYVTSVEQLNGLSNEGAYTASAAAMSFPFIQTATAFFVDVWKADCNRTGSVELFVDLDGVRQSGANLPGVCNGQRFELDTGGRRFNSVKIRWRIAPDRGGVAETQVIYLRVAGIAPAP